MQIAALEKQDARAEMIFYDVFINESYHCVVYKQHTLVYSALLGSFKGGHVSTIHIIKGHLSKIEGSVRSIAVFAFL